MSPMRNTHRLELVEPKELSDQTIKAIMPDMVMVVGRRTYAKAPEGPTGNLKQGVEGYTDQGGMRGVIVGKSPHTHLVHEGVKPHQVTLETKKALKFHAGGEIYVRVAVKHHPGHRAQPFITDAAEESKPELQRILRDAV